MSGFTNKIGVSCSDYCRGCVNEDRPASYSECAPCQYGSNHVRAPEPAQENTPALTGGSSDYYKVRISNPTSPVDAYTAECNDIIEALGMNYAEGNAFKAIWRVAAKRRGTGKPGTTAFYDSEKVVFFGQRMMEQNRG